MGDLRGEIRQDKPFGSPAEEVFLNLLRTHDRLSSGVARLLRKRRLSLSQYNVLRILRGAGKDGLSCSEIAARMISEAPDMTRLLDGLEARQLVERWRDAKDRRLVNVRLAKAGAALAASLDRPVDALLRGQLEHMHEGDLHTLAHLLARAREGSV